MENHGFGIIIRVNDLNLCRMFYRDILKLGEPFFDSSFLVQFKLSSDFSLTLESSSAAFLEHASSATAWFLSHSDPDQLNSDLVNAGYPALENAIRFGNEVIRRGRDPENNIFYVRTK